MDSQFSSLPLNVDVRCGSMLDLSLAFLRVRLVGDLSPDFDTFRRFALVRSSSLGFTSRRRFLWCQLDCLDIFLCVDSIAASCIIFSIWDSLCQGSKSEFCNQPWE